jgi:ATP-dependent protease ClpP protease subunit
MLARLRLKVLIRSVTMATIDIYGVIGQESWWERSCNTTKAVSDRLDKIPEGEEITVRINSLGGSVVDGLGIYNLLKARGEFVTTMVVGCAASMAGVIMCAGHTAIAPATALVMIHSPSSIVWGTAEEMRTEADTLDVMRSAMVAAYVEKSGLSEEAVLALMSKDSWMTGTEAAAMGFCEVGEVESVDPPNENDGEEDDDDEMMTMMFGSAKSDKKILKFPESLKLPAAKERKKFEKLGWQFERAATGDRFAASAVAAPPKVSPTKTEPTSTPAHKVKEEKPVTTEQNAEVVVEAIALTPTQDLSEVMAQLASIQAEAKARQVEVDSLKAANAHLQKSMEVTAQYSALRAKAEALRTDLKLPPTKITALFSGDRASAESLIASPKLDNHLFYLEEALAEAEASTPLLQTGFRVNDEIDDSLPSVPAARATADESPESVKAHGQILAKAKELGVDPNTRDGYLKAMNAVGYNG